MVTCSSVLSACYCLDGRCVFKSLATHNYDRITDCCFQPSYVHLSAARNILHDILAHVVGDNSSKMRGGTKWGN
jgi:hypothetical protein